MALVGNFDYYGGLGGEVGTLCFVRSKAPFKPTR